MGVPRGQYNNLGWQFPCNPECNRFVPSPATLTELIPRSQRVNNCVSERLKQRFQTLFSNPRSSLGVPLGANVPQGGQAIAREFNHAIGEASRWAEAATATGWLLVTMVA